MYIEYSTVPDLFITDQVRSLKPVHGMQGGFYNGVSKYNINMSHHNLQAVSFPCINFISQQAELKVFSV